MKIHFIGTSHGVPEIDRYCSCTVVTVKNKHYVVDAGVSLYSALLHNGYRIEDVNAICITHMHGDHASGLVEFVDLLSWANRDLNPGIFVPCAKGKNAILKLCEIMDGGRKADISVYSQGLVFHDENVKITAFRTRHTDASFGFLIEGDGQRVYFSGDMQRDISDCPDFVYNEPTDLIICECAHNCMPKIADKLNQMQCKTLIMNHVAPKHALQEFEECKPLINKPFVMAFDGMEVVV